MMLKYFITMAILFLILLSASAKAQKLEVGFRLEDQGLIINQTNNKKEFFGGAPDCLQVTLAYYPLKNLSFELRGGRDFGFNWEIYKGNEYGLFSKYFFTKAFYITAGIVNYSNDGGGGHGYFGGRYSVNITMPSIGFGFKPWEHVGFDLLYQKANNQSVASEIYYKDNLSWLIKLGVVFAWDIFLF